jgi:hypothetical protein
MIPESSDSLRVGQQGFEPEQKPSSKSFKAKFRNTWKPLLLGFGVGAVVVGAAAGATGYVWHQNDVKEDRATSADFATEKAGAVKSARAEGVEQGTQDGYAQYKQEAEQAAAKAEEEAQEPYDKAKANLAVAKTVCLTSKADKRGVTVTDHSVTFVNGGTAKGASIDVIGCMLGGIDTDSATIDKINQTRALDGRQEDTWGVWEASWGYHPDNGLDLVAEIKDAPTD